jgi:hypothetical protein
MNPHKCKCITDSQKAKILDALGIDVRRLKCRICKKALKLHELVILPPVFVDRPVNATLCCNTDSCIGSYLSEIQV